ncbi:uncharacterized protein [Chelonus insularis]|uniref:uncharacterized protein n=1 Tax=Chelonus insularis TaxID=460826 RepID=UPI00158DAB54|nr:uncharacterized protein LOC118065338 [Chelonus insularis]
MLIIQLIFFIQTILWVNNITYGHYLSPLCPREREGLYSYPGVCDVYFSCEHGNVMVHACESGLVFDPVFTTCVEQEKVTYCKNDCSIYPFGRLPHPKRCDKYIECIDGKIHVKKCKVRGTVYNMDDCSCDLRENVPGCNPKVVKALNLRGDLNIIGC